LSLVSLAFLFLFVALAYSSVGFGGGSTYNALLVLADFDFRAIPLISLTCNLLVVSGGVYHFHKTRQLEVRALAPFVLLSVPCAWLGGRIPVTEQFFVGLLGLALLFAGVQTLGGSFRRGKPRRGLHINPWLIGLPSGALIGLLSGVVGIGGGIFLSPLLYFTTRREPREIAALASGFILVNSFAGLTGQLMKYEASPSMIWLNAWPLYLAVIAGGQVGSRLSAKLLPQFWVQRLTAGLIIYVALRLLVHWFELVSVV